jgi:OmpA-OmpF porin, OOP family
MMNTKALLVLLGLLAWILFCNWWWCYNKEACDCDKNTTALVEPSVNSDDGIIRFSSNSFGPQTGTAWNPFKDSICKAIELGKRVEITGYYGANEKNETSFSNLGLARADTIKDIILAQLAGKNANRISLRSELQNSLDGAANPFIASNLILKDTIATPSAAGGVVATDSNDILIYFPTGSATKEASAEVDAYLTKLGARLKASGEKAIVTGHTDNKGAVEKNLALSKDRAMFVKSILLKHDAIDANITTDGKADKEPIGDNATDAGRRQNRRVRIQISK